MPTNGVSFTCHCGRRLYSAWVTNKWRFCFDRSNTGIATKELGSVEAPIGRDESVPLDLCMNRSGEYLLRKHIKACHN